MQQDMQYMQSYVSSWARQLQQHNIQEGWFGSRSTELHGYRGEQEVLLVDLLAKGVLESCSCLPLQMSRTAAELQRQIGPAVKDIFGLETHKQDVLLGLHRQCTKTMVV